MQAVSQMNSVVPVREARRGKPPWPGGRHGMRKPGDPSENSSWLHQPETETEETKL